MRLRGKKIKHNLKNMKTKIALVILFISGSLFAQEQKMTNAEIAL
jgi:outer membrane lipoprotein carrier protein